MRIEEIFKRGQKPRYNWVEIWKEYRKLGFPPDLWLPTHIDMNATAHKIVISKRSTGKTTQFLILGCLLHKMYNVECHYIRAKVDTIAKKNASNLFKNLVEFGYIEKLTNGKYHDIYLYADNWRYCNRDENGKIIEESEVIWHMMSIQNSEEITKSNYNAPHGDYIVIDEFMRSGYMPDEFRMCLDLISTIGRERPEVYTIFLANSLNYYNQYLQEFGISREIRKMSWGEKRVITSGCVPIYVELIDPDINGQTEEKKEKKRVTMFRFGFDNPNLASITGVGGWNIKEYPHLPHFIELEKCEKLHQVLLELNGDMVRLEIYYKEDFGKFMYVVPTRTNRQDLVRYTLNPTNINDRFGVGVYVHDKKVWEYILYNRVYYAVNECGLIVEEYYNEYKNRKFK